MDQIRSFFIKVIENIQDWVQQSSLRDRLIAGGSTLLFFILIIWGIFALTAEDFSGGEVVDDAYSAFISGYTAGVISSESSIQIKFTRAIADSSWIGKEAEEDFFRFNPDLKGKAYWLDAQTLEFIPDNPLQDGQRYQVKLALNKLRNVPDRLGSFEYALRTMEQDYSVQIDGLTYEDREDLVNPILSGKLLTADFAEAAAVEKILAATQNDNQLDIQWQHEASNRSHRFVVRNIIRQSGDSEVQIIAQGDPIAVNERQDFLLQIPSLENFTLTGNRIIEEPEQYLELRFSDPLQENQDLRGLIQLRQAEDLRFVVDNNLLKVYPSSALSGPATLIINEGIKNSRGERLAKTTEVDVLFEPIKPAVRFVNDGVILPASDELMLPFEAVNLRSVDVTVVKVFQENLSQFFQINQYDGNQELRRVAKPVAQQRVPLNASGATDLGSWNRFTLDLSEIINPDPGALYQIVLSFRQSQSVYECISQEAVESDGLTAYTMADNRYDPSKIYWDAYNQYYYAPGYSWEERDNPCSPSYYGFRRSARTNVMASNLGVIAKRGEDGMLYVNVSDLQTTEPLSGVDISIYDFQQILIAEESTDGDGELKVITERTPYLLIASDGEQRSYLRVDDGNSLSLSNFDISGEEVRQGYKGFIYGDRGVWRPGDSLHINFILEDEKQSLPDAHPVIFELKNPRGQVVQRLVNTNPVGNIYNFSTSTESDAITGNWSAQVNVGGATFSKNLRIETVKPNRLKVDLDFRADRFTARNSRPTGYLDVAWLSGATARNLRAEYDLQLTPAKTNFEDYPNHNFDDEARDFSPQRRQVFDGRVNERGKINFDVNLRLEQDVPGVLNATFVGKVYEEGGNFSTDRLTLPYYPYSSFVGIDLPEGEGMGGMLLTGEPHSADIVVVDERGRKFSSRKVEMSLYKMDWRWWWEQSGNDIANYVNNEYRKPVLQETVNAENGETDWVFTIKDQDWGRYYLRACDPASGHCTGEVIYVDRPGYAGRDGRNQPKAEAMLSFSAEKTSYEVDEEATIHIPAQGGGRALVSIEDGSRVLETFSVELEENEETNFSFDISEEMAPNIYVHVSLLQPHASTANDLPIRMYGILPLEVTNSATVLEPILSMPEKMEPESEVIITVGEAEERPMAYTIAMVDEGLLDITNFETPKPHDYFYAREALGVKTWDLYDYVIGAYGGQLERILAIGGDEAGLLNSNRSANRFKPVVKFIGPFFLEDGDENTHTIKIPNYVGSVRTMLVAAHEGAYGFTEAVTPVNKSLMVLGTLPRVLGPGEQLQLPVDIFAMDNSVKSVRVSVSADGPLNLGSTRSEEMFFPNPGEKLIEFDLSVAKRTGIGNVEVNAAAGPIRSSYNVEIDIRNPLPPVTESLSSLIEGGGSWETSYEAFGMEGTRQVMLELSDIPPLNLSHRMQYLITYPHGCVEQTISSAFPQLYLSSVAEVTEEEQRRIESNIRQAIQRLMAFRTNEGAFAYWPGSNDADEWSTSYAGHFLLEAQQRGYLVPPGLLQGWLSYQSRRAAQWGRSLEYSREDLVQAYRLYTLALAGQAEQGAMNRMRELSNLSLAASWRLAAAFVLVGQNEVAEDLISGLNSQVEPYRESYGTYGSSLRDQAMILETLGLLQKREQGLILFRRISAALSSENWLSTQTTAFSIIAASKFADGMQLGQGIDAVVEIEGQPPLNLQSNLSVMQREIDISRSSSHDLRVRNLGDAELYARVILRGQPSPGEETTLDNGLGVNVSYKGTDGEPVNTRELNQGTDFVAEVTVYNPGTQGDLQQLALSHIFPSGWEILNTRLMDLEAFNQQSEYDYQNIRDDRVYTYFGLAAGERKTFRVMLNASYAGRFYQPSIYCESMYDNTVNAGKKGQWVEVVKP